MIISSSTSVKLPPPVKVLAIKNNFLKIAQSQAQVKIETRDELWRHQEALLLQEQNRK